MKSTLEIIGALIELEAKGCHSVFYEYGDGLFKVRIMKGTAWTGKIVYERTINPTNEQAELDRLSAFIMSLNNSIMTTVFQCYVREFIKGEKSGNWEKTTPIIEFGDNSDFSMLNDGSGYYLNDPANGVQYFVDMRQISVTN
jgi:hypothetical protein